MQSPDWTGIGWGCFIYVFYFILFIYFRVGLLQRLGNDTGLAIMECTSAGGVQALIASSMVHLSCRQCYGSRGNVVLRPFFWVLLDWSEATAYP